MQMNWLLLSMMVMGAASVVCAAAESAPAPRVPDLLWHDARVIEAMRQRAAAGDATLAPALQRLRADADAALRQPPVTVTAKQVIPPGGTRHDYRSLAPYWWPDPAKEDGLPWIRRDGQTNPQVEDPRHSDRPALGKLVSAVETLGWAYLFFGEERYAAHAATMLRVFFIDEATRMTPHLRYAQAIPGHNDGRFIGIIDTRKLAVVLDAAVIMRSSKAWSADDHAALTAWFAAFTHWLTTHEFGRDEAAHPNNHGTWYDVQVASYARFLGQEELLQATLRRARGRIEAHIERDGRQPHELARTRSFNYSVMNLWGFVVLAQMGERAGVDLWNHADQRLRRAVEYLAPYADSNQAWPHPQIAPMQRASLAPVLRAAAHAYRDARFEAASKSLGEAAADDRLHLLGARLQ